MKVKSGFMKVLFNKLKKVNKLALILFLISVFFYFITYSFITTSLVKLTGIETFIRYFIIILFLIYFIIYIITGLVSLITKKKLTYTILITITLLFSTLFGIGSFYINKIYSKLDLSKDTIVYTVNLITLKETEFNNSSTIGIVKNSKETNYNLLAKKLVEEENYKNKTIYYDDIYLLLDALYNKDVDGIIVNGNYKILFSSDERYADIETRTKEISSYNETRKNEDNLNTSNKALTSPFSILLMGVDSEYNGLQANQAFNGDTLMLLTFNPKTLTLSMFSIPRDLYVPIACNNNKLAKINSSAAYGTNCVISTIKKLTDIDIDYFVKINFKGVVELVDTLGGINVDVGIDFCEQNSNREFGDKLICLNKGYQKLNGEQALAFARHRKTLIRGDIDRIANQQKVVEALLNEVKNINNFKTIENILEAINNNIDTNITRNQILSLYHVAKNILINNTTLNIKKTYLEYYDLPVYLPYSNTTTSALGYYKESLDDIVHMMKVNLGKEKEEINKTYNIDANEEYTSMYYGKNLRGEKLINTMINLIGKNLSEAESFATKYNLTLVTSEEYNPDMEDNTILEQSIPTNAILDNYDTLTVIINNLNKIENVD